MKGFIRGAILATMLGSAGSAAYAQGLPSASDVVASYVKAIGGRDAVLKITSMTQLATMNVPAAGISAEMKVMAAAPNKLSSTSTIEGIGEMVQGFNGTIGWDINPMQGPRLLTDAELAQALKNNDFHGSRLFPADQYTSMTVLEKVPFNNEPAYKVRMVHTSGIEATNYFSVANGLLIGADMTQESPMGAQTVQLKYFDYKEQAGVKSPMRTEMSMGPTVIIITVKSTTLNDVPESAFEIPAAIKSMIGK